ncbi:MAG: THUMP domain-containing protein [Candidatus Nitrosocaldaceae archaeon]
MNLIATTYRHAENKVIMELKEILGELGDNNAKIEYTNISGLVRCSTKLDAKDVIRRVKEIINEEPWRFRFILRLIPIDIVTNTEISKIRDIAIKLSSNIKEGESYKIEIEKRFTTLKSKDIISSIAEAIDRRVDLEEPDWIILIEIIGRDTGISLLKKDEIFSLVKSKRSID